MGALEFKVRHNSPDSADPADHFVRAECYNLRDALLIADAWRKDHYPMPMIGNKDYVRERRQHNIYVEWVLHEGESFEHRNYYWDGKWHPEVPEWRYRLDKR